jgi:hypothetical protein
MVLEVLSSATKQEKTRNVDEKGRNETIPNINSMMIFAENL